MELTANNIVIAMAVFGNIVSVVGVVLTNKYIVDVDGFNFMIFLSFLHFAFTTFGTRVLLGAGMFTYAPASVSSVMPVAVVCLSRFFFLLCVDRYA